MSHPASDEINNIMRQRGKVVALLVLCGTVVSLVHPDTATTIFPAVALAVGALASMEAYAASKGGGQ
jgi:hypothetical protein